MNTNEKRYGLETATAPLPARPEFKLLVTFGEDLPPANIDFQVPASPGSPGMRACDEALSLLARVETRRGMASRSAALYQQEPGVVRLRQISTFRPTREQITRRKSDLPLYVLWNAEEGRAEPLFGGEGLPIVGDSPEELVDNFNAQPEETDNIQGRSGRLSLVLRRDSLLDSRAIRGEDLSGRPYSGASEFSIRAVSRLEYEKAVSIRRREYNDT